MDRPPELMSDRELVCALDQADVDLARLETRRLRLVAALDKSGYAEEVGARDTVQFLEYRYRLDHHRARRDVRLARALPKYTAVTAALPDTGTAGPSGDGPSGDGPVMLRPAQAEPIVTALEKVPSTVPVADLEVAERELVRLARHLPPAELRKAAEQVRDILDTDGPEPKEYEAYARESLTLTPADRGVKFRGYLANENAELLRSVIVAGARPHKTLDGEPDQRSREKRQADALATALTVAAATLDAATLDAATIRTGAPGAPDGGSGAGSGNRAVVPGFGAKANITVTIDLDDLRSATADAVGTTVHSGGLSAATIRRLACDANVIPIVLGSNSEPLDVGRRERLVTRAMRRALNTRDRGCVVCGAPPVMCDAHHLISWIDGGVTAVSNLALLCRRHHVDLHNGHWTITITDGAVHVARPRWADPPPALRLRPTAAGPTGDGPRTPEPPNEEHARPDPRTGRWQADAATYAEAAQFAVWGSSAPTESCADPPPSSRFDLACAAVFSDGGGVRSS
ncbi:DUF222 domain-containing protein [Kribbella sp. HUAS MG21]|uniref:DUF222 domain-containing protein n=1 Tax=Kribbella sp. HUAS MG21 TaxID=3160966 RepID=A0AAU7T3T1_9ACTN